MKGGINLGFLWSVVVDEERQWSAPIENNLCKAEMTVDVTPRNCQKFKAVPGDKFRWTSSTGDSDDVTADQWGLVTLRKLKIQPRAKVAVSLSLVPRK